MGKGGKHVDIWGKLSRQREGQVKSPLKKAYLTCSGTAMRGRVGRKKVKDEI